MTRSTFLRALLVSTLTATQAAAATINVSKTGTITSIQDAIDLASAGDKIVIEAGTYQENPRIASGKSGLQLTAKGVVIVEALKAGGLNGGAGIVVDASNVKLTGLTIRNANAISSASVDLNGIGLVVRADGFVGKQLKIHESDDRGIYSTGSNAKFIDCELRGNDVGMYLEDAVGITIERCVIRQCDEYGLEFQDVTDLEITHCEILGIEDGSCVASDGGTNAEISIHDNRLVNADSSGIEVNASALVIERNELLGTGGGIAAAGDGLIVRDNTITATQGNDALEIDDTVGGTIERNTIRDFGRIGLSLRSTTSGITVRDNVLRDGHRTADAAIRIDGIGHIVERNVVKDVSGDAFFLECQDSTFTANVVKRAGRDGFDLSNSAILCTLNDNKVSDCGAEGLDHTGIFATISGNSFSNCRIDVAAVGTLNEFTENSFVSGGQGTLPEID